MQYDVHLGQPHLLLSLVGAVFYLQNPSKGDCHKQTSADICLLGLRIIHISVTFCMGAQSYEYDRSEPLLFIPNSFSVISFVLNMGHR